MRSSVLSVWRAGRLGSNEATAGEDPWTVVDEAWASMAKAGFRCEGPFVRHACVVARNKAVDSLRRAERRVIGPSLDATIRDDQGDEVGPTWLEASSEAAEEEYFAAQRLAQIEDALYLSLDPRERAIFFQVRVDGKSGAAVGREMSPPISGQRVGQILAVALIKIQAYLERHRDELDPLKPL